MIILCVEGKRSRKNFANDALSAIPDIPRFLDAKNASAASSPSPSTPNVLCSSSPGQATQHSAQSLQLSHAGGMTPEVPPDMVQCRRLAASIPSYLVPPEEGPSPTVLLPFDTQSFPPANSGSLCFSGPLPDGLGQTTRDF